MDVARIIEILVDCLGNHTDGEPLPNSEIVDVWELIALKPDKVRAHEAEMIELLRKWPNEWYGFMLPSLG